MAYNYSQLWEAFISGEGGWADPVKSGESWDERTQQFYGAVVGPAFGQTDDFGQEFKDYIAAFEIGEMERAEETFRMSIGDPYGGTAAGDPFAWERISRYDPTSGQSLLEEELHKYGEQLGGDIGAEYGTGMVKETASYTEGLQAQREGLTYGGLVGGQGLVSGTSGAVLRSGEGVTQAEDVLAEAYEKSKSLGAEYTEGKEGIETDLRTNLDNALTTYLAALDDEKEAWYGRIMDDVIRKVEITGITTESEVEAGFSAYEGDVEWGCGYGLKWESTDADGNPVCVPLVEGEEGYEDIDYEFRASGACGIGMLWIVDDSPAGGSCQVREGLDLTYGKYGEYCATDTLVNCADGTQACPGECEEAGEGTVDPVGTETGDITVQCPPGSLGPDGTGQATGQHIYDYTNCAEITDEHEGEDTCLCQTYNAKQGGWTWYTSYDCPCPVVGGPTLSGEMK